MCKQKTQIAYAEAGSRNGAQIYKAEAGSRKGEVEMLGIVQVDRTHAERPRRGLRVGDSVQIAFGVFYHGGREGSIYGFGPNAVVVTVDGSESFPEEITWLFAYNEVLRFGLHIGQEVQIALDVPGHGGQEGTIYGFSGEEVAVTISGFSSDPETRTVCFDPNVVLPKAA